MFFLSFSSSTAGAQLIVDSSLVFMWLKINSQINVCGDFRCNRNYAENKTGYKIKHDKCAQEGVLHWWRWPKQNSAVTLELGPVRLAEPTIWISRLRDAPMEWALYHPGREGRPVWLEHSACRGAWLEILWERVGPGEEFGFYSDFRRPVVTWPYLVLKWPPHRLI